jgi:RNA methyltransferase, TrmH family
VPEVVTSLRSAGLAILAADGSGELSLGEVALDRPTAWMFGNEAWGLPSDVLALADEAVSVPIYGKAESLNLAAAAAVCLYASAARQNGGAAQLA